MRWLAVVSVLVTGCASIPQPTRPGMATVAMHPPATLHRPWLVQTRSDEITVFDTRILRALREVDETGALNANGSGRVKMPGLWVAIGLSAVAAVASEDTSDDGGCVLGTNCH